MDELKELTKRQINNFRALYKDWNNLNPGPLNGARIKAFAKQT